MEEGHVVDALPPEAPKSLPRDDYDWDGMALLAKGNPGKAVLAAKHVRITRVTSLRGYRREPFRSDEGRIKIALRGSSVEDDGYRYGDVWFTWEPAPKQRKKK